MGNDDFRTNEEIWYYEHRDSMAAPYEKEIKKLERENKRLKKRVLELEQKLLVKRS